MRRRKARERGGVPMAASPSGDDRKGERCRKAMALQTRDNCVIELLDRHLGAVASPSAGGEATTSCRGMQGAIA